MTEKKDEGVVLCLDLIKQFSTWVDTELKTNGSFSTMIEQVNHSLDNALHIAIRIAMRIFYLKAKKHKALLQNRDPNFWIKLKFLGTDMSNYWLELSIEQKQVCWEYVDTFFHLAKRESKSSSKDKICEDIESKAVQYLLKVSDMDMNTISPVIKHFMSHNDVKKVIDKFTTTT